MSREDILNRLAATKTEAEWNDICDDVKRANAGDYPNWWFSEVILSGLASRKRAHWYGRVR